MYLGGANQNFSRWFRLITSGHGGKWRGPNATMTLACPQLQLQITMFLSSAKAFDLFVSLH